MASEEEKPSMFGLAPVKMEKQRVLFDPWSVAKMKNSSKSFWLEWYLTPRQSLLLAEALGMYMEQTNCRLTFMKELQAELQAKGKV